MTEHYYSEKPIVDHDEKLIDFSMDEKKFVFKTDAGVFSKNRVDFGTSLLINSFDPPIEGRILDLGCGYGPVGVILASYLEKGKVVLADINERAIDLAKGNLQRNKSLISLDIEISVKKSNGFDNITESFNYILLNPPIRAGKETIYQLYEDAYEHLNDKGEFWIVVQKKQGAPSSIKKLEEIYMEVEVISKSKGYYIIKSIK